MSINFAIYGHDLTINDSFERYNFLFCLVNEEALSASSRYISSYNSHNLLTFLNSGYDDGRKIIEDSISRIIRSVLLKENISMDVRTFCSSYYDMSKFYGVTHKRMLAKYQELQQKKQRFLPSFREQSGNSDTPCRFYQPQRAA